MTSYELREHKLKLTSIMPATKDKEIVLPVREYDGTHGHDREPVLMLHGRSVPALAGFDLVQVPGGDPDRYSWAKELAQAGYDVFIMDLQGSGRSTRPGQMDDPCNTNPAGRPQIHGRIALPDDVVVGSTAGRAGCQACGGRVRPILTGRQWPVKQEPEVVPRWGPPARAKPRAWGRYGPESPALGAGEGVNSASSTAT